MKLGGGMGRSVFCGALLSVLAAAPLAACGDDSTGGGTAGDDGIGGDGAGNGTGGAGGGGSENPIASCDDRSTDGTKVSGTIDSDTTWSGRVYLESSVTVSGATLTIEPGTVVIAAAGSELSVSAGGAIVSGGTEDDPIAFCGESGEAGLWAGISVADDAATTSELSYTLVSNAGSGDAALVLDAATLVAHVAVTDSGADGVRARIFAADSTDLTVVGAEGAPAVLTHAAAVSPFPVGGDLTGNGDDHVVLDFGTADVDMTFAKLSVPYLQPEDLDITAGATTFEAGVVYQLGDYASLLVGTGSESVLFNAQGTAEAPVYLEGAEPVPGYFREIRFAENTAPESTLEHTTIRYGGPVSDADSVSVLSPIKLVNVLLEKCELGMWISASGLDMESQNLTLSEVAWSGPLRLEPDALLSIPEGTIIQESTYDFISVDDGVFTKTGTLKDLPFPYYLGSLVIHAAAALTVPAGSRLELDRDGSLEILGRLVVAGTAEAPVTFDCPYIGTWSKISVAHGADATTSFDFVHFIDGQTCLELHRPVNVSNSTFEGCDPYSVRGNTAAASPSYDSDAYNAELSGNDYGGTNPSYGSF